MSFLLYIVSVHPLAAKHLSQTLCGDAELKSLVCPTVIDTREKMYSIRGPSLFILDLYALPVELQDALRILRLQGLDNRFLALVGPAESNRESMLRFLFLGVHGVTNVVSDSLDQMVNSVREILAGHISVPASVLGEYVRQTKVAFENRSFLRRSLTARQIQIAEMLALRQSNRQIGEALGIAERTVKFHVSNILNALRIEHRRQLWGRDRYFGTG